MIEETVMYSASGFSMWPFLKPGERLLVKNTPPAALGRGDIVVYERGDIVCHRLINKEHTGGGWVLYVRGDNQLEREAVAGDRYKGRVVAVFSGRSARSLTGPLARALGYVLACVLPVVVRCKRAVRAR